MEKNKRLDIELVENEYFKSERLLYRPYKLEDLDTVHRLFNESSRRRWFYFQEPDCLTKEFALEQIKNNIDKWSKQVNVLEGGSLAMVLKETGELIGSVGIGKSIRPDVHLNGLELGYHVAEAHQGKGYATEGAKAAIEWVIEHCQKIDTYPIIECHVEHEHWASRRVAEKSGFIFNRSYKYITVYVLNTKPIS